MFVSPSLSAKSSWRIFFPLSLSLSLSLAHSHTYPHITGIPGRARGASASSSSSRRPKKPASSLSGNSQKDAGQFHAANGDLESGTEVEDDGSFPSKSHFLESESVYDSSDATSSSSSSSFYQSSSTCPVLLAVTIIIWKRGLIIPVFPLILLPVRAVFG